MCSYQAANYYSYKYTVDGYEHLLCQYPLTHTVPNLEATLTLIQHVYMAVVMRGLTLTILSLANPIDFIYTVHIS